MSPASFVLLCLSPPPAVVPESFTPAAIFTSIALFGLMRFPLIFLPFALIQLSNALVSTHPFIYQPMIPPASLAAGANFATAYNGGIRGVLPNGTLVLVDANVSITEGAATNEDEIYVVASRECHLWEDSGAPTFIRAEQTSAASLGVLFVVYKYLAYTVSRYPSANGRIAGTGLATPSF